MIFSRTTRQLLWALGLSFAAFVLWLIPSYIVMSPDSTHQQQVLQEAELVAAAIARGGMAKRPSSKIGDPNDPRIIAARARSPFHKNRTEGIMRQMQPIIQKRIILYDHRRRLLLDSYNFKKDRVTSILLPDVSEGADKNQTPGKKPTHPSYLPPPKGDNRLVLSALAGQSLARQILPKRALNNSEDNKFKPRQPILFVVAPVRRLKLVEGAVVLIDDRVAERTAWRWRSLWEDNLPFSVAAFVVLALLLLWLHNTFIAPLSRLAYRAEKTDTNNRELEMLSQRQEIGQLTARNFSYATSFFQKHQNKKASTKERQAFKDSQMASMINNTLVDEKLETTNLALLVQQIINRQNTRERNHILRKNKKGHQELAYKNKIQIEKMNANNHNKPWLVPLFANSLELCLDYFVQTASNAQSSLWENSVRLSLVRHKKTIELVLEDDGEDITGKGLGDWLKRSLDETQFAWTKASIEKTIAMCGGSLSVSALRPARLKLTLPLKN